MRVCDSIETLAMAYLDDELAGEERRELELHILECAGCRVHVDTERAELAVLRGALAPPPAPELMRARIVRMLDSEDRESMRQQRRRPIEAIKRWLLPGTAIAAAAAAVVVAFTALRPRSTKPPVEQEVVQQIGAFNDDPLLQRSVGPAPAPVDRPSGYQIERLSQRPTEVSGHNALRMSYVVTIDGRRYSLTGFMIDDLKPSDLGGGNPIRIGDRTYRVHNAYGMPAVTYIDEFGMGYAFGSERLSAQQLLEVVASADLIERLQTGQ